MTLAMTGVGKRPSLRKREPISYGKKLQQTLFGTGAL